MAQYDKNILVQLLADGDKRYGIFVGTIDNEKLVSGTGMILRFPKDTASLNKVKEGDRVYFDAEGQIIAAAPKKEVTRASPARSTGSCGHPPRTMRDSL